MLSRSIFIFYLWCLHYTIVSISISHSGWRRSLCVHQPIRADSDLAGTNERPELFTVHVQTCVQTEQTHTWKHYKEISDNFFSYCKCF